MTEGRLLELINDPERIGSKRSALKNDPEFAELFKKATPEELNQGKLIGKLLEKGFGIAQINDVFSWWELEFNKGEKLTNLQQALSLFQALMHCDISDNGLRTLKKMFAQVNQKD